MTRDRSKRHFALFTHLRTAWRALWHRQVPWFSKFLILAAAVYAISPIDVVPDVIPIAGWLDDAAIVTLMISLAFRMLPPRVMAECEGVIPAGPTVHEEPAPVKGVLPQR